MLVASGVFPEVLLLLTGISEGSINSLFLSLARFGGGALEALLLRLVSTANAFAKANGTSLAHDIFVRTFARARANFRLYLSENSVLLILIPLKTVSPASC